MGGDFVAARFSVKTNKIFHVERRPANLGSKMRAFPRDEIHVYGLRLDPQTREPARIASWYKLLSDSERKRADSFRLEEHRRDFIACHAALRFVLGRYLQILPSLVKFEGDSTATRVASKPALASDCGLRFNLSHTRGAALICVAGSREVGIDIEQPRPIEDLDSLAQTVMSSTELSSWKSLGSPDRNAAFYRLWTRKESYLKAIGLGLYRDLQQVAVPVSAKWLVQKRISSDDGPRQYRCRAELVVDNQAEDGATWLVADLPSFDQYSASICFGIRGEGDVLPVLELQDLEIDLDLSGIAAPESGPGTTLKCVVELYQD